MALPIKTRSRRIGEVLIQVNCLPCEGEYLDSNVFINDKLLCCISWPDVDSFIGDIDKVIEKYRI